MIKESVIREFLNNNSDDEIRYLGLRIRENLQDDLAEVFNFISKSNARNIGIDEIFRSAHSVSELYECCDLFRAQLYREADKRRVSLIRGRANGRT